jgi:hypothetical protein
VLTDALAPRATIPQRLDRLPLTWTLWRLALVTQAGWALVVATDAIAARIYPFIWGPRHAFDTAAFSILLLVSTGVGIVIGEYLFACWPTVSGVGVCSWPPPPPAGWVRCPPASSMTSGS